MIRAIHLLFLVFAGGAFAAPPAAGRPEAGRPNIVFLFADDQRADTIGAHGNPHIVTPNLDRMAKDGTSFLRNYCAGSYSGAVCVASRAMLMTGRDWIRIQNANAIRDWKNLPLLPERLAKDGGYRTHIVGKWHNGFKTLERAFTEGTAVYMGGMADHTDFDIQDLVDGKLTPKRDAVGFTTEVFADAAIEFIREAEADQPFFLYVSMMVPHDTRNPPMKYREMYYKNRPPLPENFMPLHPFRNNSKATTSGRDEALASWPRTKADISDQLCEYYGLITHMDEQIGRVMAAIDGSPHKDNTVVIFTADHGLGMGSHGLLGKQNIYEQSMACPLILRGPGIPAGASNHNFTTVHDLYATCLSLGGVAPTPGVDAIDLTHHWKPEAGRIRPVMFLPFQDEQRSVNDGIWKLHLYPKIGHRLLFNLEDDPHEMNNLAEDPKFAGQIARLTKLLEEERKRVGDTDPLVVDEPLPKEAVYDESKRYPDKWQPKWIRDKYFHGREYKGK